MKKAIISILMIMALVLVPLMVGATYSIPNETTAIGGQVTDSDGKPISGALVLAHSSYGTEYAISDNSGQYIVNNIPIFEDIKISCSKEHYKTFRTSVYIDMVGICLVLDIELQKKINNIAENSIVHRNPDSTTHTFCRGFAYGEIEDYELSPIAKLIFLLRGKPSELLISRATIVIKNDPDMMSLELINPIKKYCMAYYGDITIHFYASMININLDAVENCENCTYIVCQGFFGIINVEQN